MNDIAGWIFFSVLARHMSVGGGGSHGLLVSTGLTLGFVVVTLVVLRPVVDRWLRAMQPSPDEPAPTPRVLSMVMVLALLGASATEALGIHAEPLPDAGELMTRETADPFPGDSRFATPPRR